MMHSKHVATFMALCGLLLGCCEVCAQEPPPEATTTGPTKANYAIVCPNVIRPGFNYRIGVALFQRSAEHGIRSVTARLNTISKAETFADLSVETAWQREADEVTASVDLQLLVTGGPNDFDPVGNYKLVITIEDTLGAKYVNSTEVTLAYSSVTTLIQTDKAVYKPGQMVKFRIVNLDETLKPVLTDMEVLIKDARGNLVDKQIHNLTKQKTWSDKAVMIGQIQLSDMPNEGDWTITATSEQGVETKSFNVRQYVLPKFTLDLTVPSFVHFNDSEFTVLAKVLYTFDRAVEGTFNITMGPDMNCRSCKSRYDQLETFTMEAPTDGEASFAFNLTSWRTSLKAKGYTHRPSYFMAKAMIQFKEKFTGETKMTESSFYIYTKRYEVKVNTSKIPFFLPGFEVPVQINLMQPDDQPFTEKAASNATVSISYQQRGKRRVNVVFNGPLNKSPSGTGVSLKVKIPTVSDFHPIRIDVTVAGDDLSELRDSSTIYPFIGVTDDYVKISMDNSREDVEMELEKTAGIRSVFYGVLSRGQMHKWGRYADSSKLTFTKADLISYVSDVTLVAFGLAQNGEIVASSVKHEMSRLGGKVGMKSNLTMDKGEPQQWASVSVMAEPESFVFITGIDASVNLLATGQDILQDSMSNRYKSRVLGSRYWPRQQRLTTGRIIQENGLIVLSDAFYYSDNDYSIYGGGGGRSRSMLGANAEYQRAVPGPPSMDLKSSKMDSGKTQVRKFFPETMVWTVVQTNSEGQASHAFRLPDTITSWHLTGFGVAANSQIQTMDEAFKVTTFKNFFIRPVLPYSLVRGEKFLLKVLAFNYQDVDSKVTIELNITGAVADMKVVPGQIVSQVAPDQIVSQAVSKVKNLLSIEVDVSANSAGMALFEVTPRDLPSLELIVKGTRSGGDIGAQTDVVVKSVIVVPEGKTVFKTRSVLLSPPANDSARPKQIVTIDYPVDSADLVPGSEVFSYSLIGDVMGPAMQNIGDLLRLPSGCGEQNMVNFAPAVFIWEYLSSTQQESSEVREKAMRVMKLGLQKQLTYKRVDGSYSAFGDEDKAGSTWLTAFVLSIYAKASAFIPIEPEALTGESVKFLIDRQVANGQFLEPPGSRVLDRGLQGSSTKASHGMTAFICQALLDVDEAARINPSMQSTIWKDLDVKGSISKCLWYVKSAFDSKADAFSSYDIALSAYLLRRAQETTTYRQASLERGLNALMTALDTQAEIASGSGGKYWTTTDVYWGSRKSGSVEATGWALLGSTLAGNTEESLQILRWLSNQQNSLGGFQSSQATVVGIRALAAFAAQSGLTTGDADIEVGMANSTTQAHTVMESRRLVLTQGKLMRGAKARVGSVVVRHASGDGFALATLSWQYNMLDSQPLSEDWKVANGLGIRLGPIVLVPPPAGQFRLNVCARANSSEGMLILRVTNPSGYSVVRVPKPSDVPGLKRVEPGSQEVVMYFDYITNEGVCVATWWNREVPVLELSPQLISLQKYYSSEQIVSASYLAPELKAMTQCKVCPECPGCEPKDTWYSWLV